MVGQIRKPHGIRGELYVVPTTDHPEDVFEPGRRVLLADRDGRPLDLDLGLTIERARPFKDGLIIAFADIEDRNAAEVLRGRTLVIPSGEALALEEDEFFLHDLTGLEVRTVEGTAVGRVERVYTVAAQNLLGVADPDGRERLIPFTRQVVREVDVDGGRIVIEPPPGLLEL